MVRPSTVWIVVALMAMVGCSKNDAASDALNDMELTSFADAELASAPLAPSSIEAGLQLQTGQSVTLSRSIRQKLTQQTTGRPVQSQSDLDVRVHLTVREAQADRFLIQVNFDNVRFETDVTGKPYVYDSRNPAGEMPPQVLPYHALNNNSFAFWLGRNNRILSVEGLDDFMKRCVEGIPGPQQRTFVSHLSSFLGEEGIASFVDETIGLLPIAEVQSGKIALNDSWKRDRQLMFPTPMYLSNNCQLIAAGSDSVDVKIQGSIAATNAFATPQPGTTSLKVRSGHINGLCRIDTATGLPQESRIEHHIDFDVTYADGTTARQTKETVTVTKRESNSSLQNTIEFAGGVPPTGGGVVPAGFSFETSAQDVP